MLNLPRFNIPPANLGNTIVEEIMERLGPHVVNPGEVANILLNYFQTIHMTNVTDERYFQQDKLNRAEIEQKQKQYALQKIAEELNRFCFFYFEERPPHMFQTYSVMVLKPWREKE